MRRNERDQIGVVFSASGEKCGHFHVEKSTFHVRCDAEGWEGRGMGGGSNVEGGLWRGGAGGAVYIM